VVYSFCRVTDLPLLKISGSGATPRHVACQRCSSCHFKRRISKQAPEWSQQAALNGINAMIKSAKQKQANSLFRATSLRWAAKQACAQGCHVYRITNRGLARACRGRIFMCMHAGLHEKLLFLRKCISSDRRLTSSRLPLDMADWFGPPVGYRGTDTYLATVHV
jgi:hypothetical protein